MGPEVEFAFQHHARFVAKEGDKEIISIYDNSAHGTEDGKGHEVHFYKHSRGKIIEVNTKTWEDTIVQVHNYTIRVYYTQTNCFRHSTHLMDFCQSLKGQLSSFQMGTSWSIGDLKEP